MSVKKDWYRPVGKNYGNHHEDIFKYCQCDRPILVGLPNEDYTILCEKCSKLVKMPKY